MHKCNIVQSEQQQQQKTEEGRNEWFHIINRTTFF